MSPTVSTATVPTPLGFNHLCFVETQLALPQCTALNAALIRTWVAVRTLQDTTEAGGIVLLTYFLLVFTDSQCVTKASSAS